MINTTEKVKSLIPYLEEMAEHELLTIISLASNYVTAKAGVKCPDGMIYDPVSKGCVPDPG